MNKRLDAFLGTKFVVVMFSLSLSAFLTWNDKLSGENLTDIVKTGIIAYVGFRVAQNAVQINNGVNKIIDNVKSKLKGESHVKKN